MLGPTGGFLVDLTHMRGGRDFGAALFTRVLSKWSITIDKTSHTKEERGEDGTSGGQGEVPFL